MRKRREWLGFAALLATASLLTMTIGLAPAGAQTTRSCDDILNQLDRVLDAEDAVFELPPGITRDTLLANLDAQVDRLVQEAAAKGCIGDDDDDDGPSGRDYVALGDSYASGEGNPLYDPKTNVFAQESPELTNLCHRSLQGSYPEYLADIEDLLLTNVTCSGAVTTHLYSRDQRNFLQGAQVNTISSETDLITITIGGNDVGFDDVLDECVRGIHRTYYGRDGLVTSDCRSSKGLLTIRLIDLLLSSTGPLGRAYDKVNSRIADVGADAKVVVVGYPQLFSKSDGGSDTTAVCGAVAYFEPGSFVTPGITQREMNFLFDAVHEANKAIRVVAEEKGFMFVDVENVFGEEGTVCGAFPLVRGVSLGLDLRRPGIEEKVVVSSSFHPTADGQKAIAARVAAEVFG